MKRITFLVTVLFIILLCHGDFIWDEPLWINQAAMIQNIHTDFEPQTVSFSEGFYVVWVESEASQGQLLSQKYSVEGEALWGTPQQVIITEQLPRLTSII